MEYLVKWLGYPYESNSWEPSSHLNCPNLIREYHMSNNLPMLGKRGRKKRGFTEKGAVKALELKPEADKTEQQNNHTKGENLKEFDSTKENKTDSTVQKRGRGRPRKLVCVTEDTVTVKRKKGRPRKTEGNKTQDVQVDNHKAKRKIEDQADEKAVKRPRLQETKEKNNTAPGDVDDGLMKNGIENNEEETFTMETRKRKRKEENQKQDFEDMSKGRSKRLQAITGNEEGKEAVEKDVEQKEKYEKKKGQEQDQNVDEENHGSRDQTKNTKLEAEDSEKEGTKDDEQSTSEAADESKPLKEISKTDNNGTVTEGHRTKQSPVGGRGKRRKAASVLLNDYIVLPVRKTRRRSAGPTKVKNTEALQEERSQKPAEKQEEVRAQKQEVEEGTEKKPRARKGRKRRRSKTDHHTKQKEQKVGLNSEEEEEEEKQIKEIPEVNGTPQEVEESKPNSKYWEEVITGPRTRSLSKTYFSSDFYSLEDRGGGRRTRKGGKERRSRRQEEKEKEKDNQKDTQEKERNGEELEPGKTGEERQKEDEEEGGEEYFCFTEDEDRS